MGIAVAKASIVARTMKRNECILVFGVLQRGAVG
jgi:hypothetical protein